MVGTVHRGVRLGGARALSQSRLQMKTCVSPPVLLWREVTREVS